MGVGQIIHEQAFFNEISIESSVELIQKHKADAIDYLSINKDVKNKANRLHLFFQCIKGEWAFLEQAPNQFMV